MIDVGLDSPVSVREFSGESGRESLDDSVMRDSDIVRSSDWARLVKERGFDNELSFAPSRGSDPRLSSLCRVRFGNPEPCQKEGAR